MEQVDKNKVIGDIQLILILFLYIKNMELLTIINTIFNHNIQCVNI